MANVTVQEITRFIEEHIPEFHRKRLENLAGLKLRKVLRRKTPYLFKAKERNEAFQIEYGKVINRFTAEFIKDFCQPDGAILLEKLVQFNSAAK